MERTIFQPLPTPQETSPAPEVSIAPVWRLGITALSRANGSVVLYVEAPGTGALRAGAQGAVVVGSAHSARGSHRARHASRAQRHASRARRDDAVLMRTVATGATGTKGAGLTMLTLTLDPVYAAFAGERGGLSATVTVTFTAPGRAPLRAGIPVTFLRATKRPKTRAREATPRHAPRAGRRR